MTMFSELSERYHGVKAPPPQLYFFSIILTHSACHMKTVKIL